MNCAAIFVVDIRHTLKITFSMWLISDTSLVIRMKTLIVFTAIVHLTNKNYYLFVFEFHTMKFPVDQNLYKYGTKMFLIEVVF